MISVKHVNTKRQPGVPVVKTFSEEAELLAMDNKAFRR